MKPVVALMIAASLVRPVQAEENYRGETLANYQVEMSTQILADSIDRRLSQIDTLFASIEALLSVTEEDKTVHAALVRMVEGVPFIRSLLVIEDTGILLHDSTSYPVVNLDLSDRGYFLSTLRSARLDLQINEVVIGRASRMPFIPITARVETSYGRRIVVAVVTPDALIPLQHRCSSCSISLLNSSGAVLASSPAGYAPPLDLLRRVQSGQEMRPYNLRTGMAPSISDWKSIQGGKMHVLYTRFAA